MAPRLQVIKLGGSLLLWPSLRERLAAWLWGESAERQVVLAGGGPWVDLLRRMPADAKLDDEALHWLAVDAMTLTARITAAMLRPQGAALVRLDGDRSQRNLSERLSVVDCAEFLRHEESRLAGPKLGVGWHVTSDSIAARLAIVLEADELVLLKSTLPEQAPWAELARQGLVDEAFPTFARQVAQVRWVNLRDESFAGWCAARADAGLDDSAETPKTPRGRGIARSP